MTPSMPRTAGRILGGIALTILSPGLGLVFARRLWTGLALLVVDEALSLGVLAITWQFAPAMQPLGWIAWVLGGALLLRLVVTVVVVLRLRAPRTPVRWYRAAWFVALAWAAISAGLDAATPSFGWRAFSVPSGSMVPTLEIGDRFIADVRTPGERPVQGDVVVFAAPGPDDTIYVKRAVGLSGDRVQLRSGHLILNGRGTPLRADPAVQTPEGEALRYNETLPSGRAYAMQKLRNDGPMNDTPEFIVPPGNLFVMGDNRDNSLDSRALGLRGGGPFGFVPMPNVLGTASLLYWPPGRAFQAVR